MDANRFDKLVQGVVSARLTRLSAIRGLAAGAVAVLTGSTFATGEVDAKKKKKKPVCRCTSSSVSSCSSVRLKKKAARKELQSNSCSYQGQCRGFNPCSPQPTSPPPSPGPECTNTSQCSGGLACINGTCQACTLVSQCNGLVCVDGLCVGGETGCTAEPEICTGDLICVGDICVLAEDCEDDDGCTGLEVCLLGLCVEQCDPSDPDSCDGGLLGLCILGICVAL